MKVTRGEFLSACGACLVGTVIGAPVLDASTAEAIQEVSPGGLDRFRDQLGTTFELREGGLSQPVTLVDVRDRSTEWRVEQVSVLFRGRHALAVGDGTYALHHPVLGRVDLFVVALPSRANGPHVYYEACISRFRSGRAPDGH